MINNLTVLGGGNAGLMVALYLRASYPELPIKVIKSENIGTIGVGEGSTEHWAMFAQATGISSIDIVKEAGATIKGGIKFENWHGDGTSYFHSLPEYMAVSDSYSGMPYTLLRLIAEGVEPGKLHWHMLMDGKHPDADVDWFFQFHFDSIKLNDFFLKKCRERNIDIINADIVDAILDDNGFVEYLIDKNNYKYHSEFFVDASGFSRIISSKLGSKWIEYSDYLPMNSAIAFPTAYQKEIPPYTLAKALSSGWFWRSPVQDRFGNGYVFSDAFISEDQAIAEIQKEFKEPIEIGKKVNFVSGRIDKFWIKNCVSVGLSSNFVEPLEASNISTTVQQSRVLAVALSTWERDDLSTIKQYNETFDGVMTNILDFIQLHYFTERNDSEFWRWCSNNMKMTEFNQEHIEMFKKNFINQTVLPSNNYNIYDILNWIQVMHGLRMFDPVRIKDIYTKYRHFEKMSKYETEAGQFVSPTDRIYTSREIINLTLEQSTEIEYKL